MQDPTPPTQAPPPPPPPAPPAAEAAAAANASGATAVLPGGATINLQGIPGSPQELQGLRERREILRDQLSRATNRREELVSQLNETGNPEARTGIQQRLALLDERILQLERDQATTEQLISNAPPEVLALATAEMPPRGGSDDEGLAMMFFFGFGIAVVVTWFIGKIRRRRRRKRGLETPAPLDDGRFERLSQAVDAIAEEVERIGEGQRFVTQLLAQRKESPGLPASERAAASDKR